MPEDKKKVLVISDYYLPGFKSGGGLRTVVNMVERLSGRYNFWIITRDHDGRLDKTPYKTVGINEWNAVGPAQVFYLSKDNLKISTIKKLVDEVEPQAIYLNSFFATPANFLLFLRRLGKIKSSVIMATCGELIAGALQFKTRKKKLHIFAAGLIGLHRGLFWKATTELERSEIEKVLGKKENMYVAADLPPKAIFPDYDPSLKPRKINGEVKLVFLARFVRTKNFAFLPDLLDNVSGRVTIDVIGDLEDMTYWKECLEKIRELPTNLITVNYLGALDNRLVPKKLAEYHFMILPTLNENFGHVFIEALSAGCPLIISDRTPWLGLEEKGVGWDIPLEDKQRWIEAIQSCVNMEQAQYRKLSDSAREFAVEWLADESLEKDTVAVIEAAICANKN